MKYSVEGNGSEVRIAVEQVGESQAALMAEFSKCAQGNCTCPSPQYAKLESIEVKPGTGRVDISLKAKPGEIIDQADINRCLEATTNKAQARSDQ